MRHDTHPRRGGFTLIELLVVITLIVVLAALAVAVAPRFSDSQKSALGASRLQSIFAIAKQRSYRDKVLSGVQLLPDPNNPGLFTQLQYVEQPDDFHGGTLSSTASPNQVRIDNADISAILPGDYLDLPSRGEGIAHRITGVNPDPTPSTGGTLSLASGLLSFAVQETNYRIIRQPRPSVNEPLVQMPADMCVDMTAVNGQGVYGPQAPNVVLFQPWGGAQGYYLTGNGAIVPSTSGKFTFWVRDKTKDTVYDGEPTLIVIYTRTGAVAAHPVAAPPATDPFLYTKDGRSSGL